MISSVNGHLMVKGEPSVIGAELGVIFKEFLTDDQFTEPLAMWASIMLDPASPMPQEAKERFLSLLAAGFMVIEKGERENA